MDSKTLGWVAVFALLAFVFLYSPGPAPDPAPGPEPPAPAPGPSPPPVPVTVPVELQPAVNALQPFPSQRKALAGLYKDWKTAVERTDVLKTTGQFATAHKNVLKTFVASTSYAGAPPVGNYIDTYLSTAVTGKPDYPDVNLDSATKAKLVAALDTIARSFDDQPVGASFRSAESLEEDEKERGSLGAAYLIVSIVGVGIWTIQMLRNRRKK